MYRYYRLLSENAITGGKDEAVKQALNQLLDHNKPKNFSPNSKSNVLLIMEKSYQKMLFSFSENNMPNSDKFTMFEFRTAIELLKERNSKLQAENDKLKKK